MAAKGSRRPAAGRSPGRAGIGRPARRRPRADRDERPTVEGSRVQLAGELAGGPVGICCGVPEDLRRRWVHFAGELAPVLVELGQLWRLP